MDKKKMFIIVGSSIGGIILLVGLFILYYVFIGSKLSYSQLESRLVSSAKLYYNQNSDSLPQNEGGEVSVDNTTLTTSGHMKEINKMTNKEITCSGKVTVTKTGDDYFYSPYIDCGDNYKTTYLSDKVKENTTISEDGSGLYALNEEVVFRGERPSNIVTFSDKTWRIVKINGSNQIVLISAESDVEKIEWDDRYNIDTESNTGINDYKMSRIRNSLYRYYDTNFKEADKILIGSQNLCIGKRNSDIKESDSRAECSEVLMGERIGLLAAYDVINASTDKNCVGQGISCQNYNYLARVISGTWWTATANNMSSYRVYNVSSGIIIPADASTTSGLRPVINLQKNLIYQGGDGTFENPYIVK